MNKENKIKKAFLIGVGGIGVSALAKYMYFQGYKIYGSDQERNENVKELEKNFDLKFFSKQDGQGVDESFDFVIYTPAISFENNDYRKAKELNIKTFSYPEFLGKISKDHFTISISGTNGKTTTTSMITEILANENNFQKNTYLKESFFSIVGGVVSKFNSNFIYFGDEKFVVESCEFKRSFLNIYPDIIVITNITEDHLDYYKNLEDIQNAFIDFLKNMLKKNIKKSKIICKISDKNLKPIIDFSQKNEIEIFDYEKYLTDDLKVSQEGQHNKENAAAALMLSEVLNLDINKAKKYLKNDFVGSKRRFEFLGKTKNKALLYDDYAHNPEGIEMIVNAMKEKYQDKKLLLIFHPHLFSRTKIFFNNFVEVLGNKNIDELIILPIYAAREKDKKEISSEDIRNELLKRNLMEEDNIKVLTKKETEIELIKNKYNKDWVILFVGAGDGNTVLYNVLDK